MNHVEYFKALAINRNVGEHMVFGGVGSSPAPIAEVLFSGIMLHARSEAPSVQNRILVSPRTLIEILKWLTD